MTAMLLHTPFPGPSDVEWLHDPDSTLQPAFARQVDTRWIVPIVSLFAVSACSVASRPPGEASVGVPDPIPEATSGGPESGDGDIDSEGDDDHGDDDDHGGDDDDSADDDDDDGADDDDDPGTKFDIGDPETGHPPDDEADPISYIWIANSAQHTVSKINTQTLIEEGRYITRPDQAGNPSRTSVGLGGNVAVANRFGGVVKIYARLTDCVDVNGNGSIETADGASYLPWGQDECIAWYTPLDYTSQRAVAWTAVEIQDDVYDEHVWVTGAGGVAGMDIDVLLLDGNTGAVAKQVAVPVQHGVIADPYGAYGGAVDSQNNLWFAGLQSGWVVRVGYTDLAVQVFANPYAGYGFTVDGNNNIWVCGQDTARLSPATGTWTQVMFPNGESAYSGGCMADGEGRLWLDISTNGIGYAMAALDINTLQLLKSYPLPVHTHGVSIDFDGYVWGVGFNDPRAFRIDPDTGATDTFSGLVGPYTYSDMTGFALSNVQDPPEG